MALEQRGVDASVIFWVRVASHGCEAYAWEALAGSCLVAPSGCDLLHHLRERERF